MHSNNLLENGGIRIFNVFNKGKSAREVLVYVVH